MKQGQIILFGIFLGICLFSTSLFIPLTGGKDNSLFLEDNILKYQYSFSFPTIVESNQQDDSYQVIIKELPLTNDFLQPRIPIKPMCLLLPYGTIVESIIIETSNKKEIAKDINLEFGGAVIPISNQSKKITMPLMQTYTYDSLSTNEIYSIIGTYVMRGYRILNLNIYPIQYNKDTGQIDFYKDIDISIQLKPSNPAGGLRNREYDVSLVSQIVENPDLLASYKNVQSTNVMDKDQYEYVIITNQNMKQADGEYNFQDLISHKESKGINATIVTIEEIINNPNFSVDGLWGDNNIENPFIDIQIEGNKAVFDDTQAKIRNFIRYAYMKWGTKYVLLAGDSDSNNKKDIIVPHRGLFADEHGLPLKNALDYEMDDIPSDVYYACLDGNFNYDGDKHFGDAPKFNIKDNKIDEADLYAEVFVGRACVDSEEEVSNIVKKSISYDKLFYDDYFQRVLFLGEYLGSAFYFNWGGKYKDLIEPIFPDEYNITKLYHQDDSWNPEFYWYLLNEHPPIIINHDGHGSPTSAMGLNCPMIEEISNDKYYFIYSHTCLAGSFDNCWPPGTYYEKDCVAEYFTVETEHGAIGAVMNSRYGLGSEDSPESPSGLYDESFFEAVFQENIKQFGAANHYSKEEHIWHINENGMRWAFYETNLFGDPELSFKDPNPKIEINIDIIRPIAEGSLYINDGSPFILSFLKIPVIVKGITINVNTETDPKGFIEYVEFLINNESVYIDDEYPYEYFLNTENRGFYDIETVAYSSYGFKKSDTRSILYLW